MIFCRVFADMKKGILLFSLVFISLILIFGGWFYQRRINTHQTNQVGNDGSRDQQTSLAGQQFPVVATAAVAILNDDDDTTAANSTFAQSYQQKLAELAQRLSKSKKLSQQEKDKLLQDEKNLEVHYQQLHLLVQEAVAIEEKILSENQAIIAEYEQLYQQNHDLWDKLNDSLTGEQTFMADQRQLINNSSVLTQEEKQILLQTQDKLDAVGKKIDVVQQQITEATKTYTQKQEEVFQKIDEVNLANFELWKKLDEEY